MCCCAETLDHCGDKEILLYLFFLSFHYKYVNPWKLQATWLLLSTKSSNYNWFFLLLVSGGACVSTRTKGFVDKWSRVSLRCWLTWQMEYKLESKGISKVDPLYFPCTIRGEERTGNHSAKASVGRLRLGVVQHLLLYFFPMEFSALCFCKWLFAPCDID